MKLVGSLLLATGFLAGAYVTVARVARVDWTFYGVCAALMIAGMVATRLAAMSAAADGHEKHDEDLDVLERALASLIEKVAALESDSSDEAALHVHQRIDADLMPDIGAFVEARESMIPRLGMQPYADVMSPFATAERVLNRAWSASADGYVDEVRSCVSSARAELQKAAELLLEARR